MTNVVRHADASRCQVELAFDGMLELTISDNGHGIDSSPGNGVGWSSMAERAAEVGGSCSFDERSEGGLVVHAALPLREAADVEVVG
jgi:signal transduction histidine kinase